MSEPRKDAVEAEKIKAEFSSCTRAELMQALADNGIKTTGREKKDQLLDMIAGFVIASRQEADKEAAKKGTAENAKGEKSPSKTKKDAMQAKTPKPAKKSSQAKTTAKSGRRRGGEVPELTKERRENVKEVRKTRDAAIESDASKAKAHGEDANLKPRQIRNAPKSLTVDGKRKAENYDREEDFKLVESFNSPSVILRGELHMVIEDRNPWVRREHPVTHQMGTYYQVAAVIKYYSRFVYIPAEYFFEDYWDMDQSRMRMFIEEREGAEVEFRVVGVNRDNPEKPVFIGSRIAAMKKNRCDFWYSDREKGRALLEPDSIHEAKVVAVSAKYVFVEMFGAEIMVPERECTYNRIKDLRTKFLPGDIVEVKVKSVLLQDKKRAAALDYPVVCELSIKEARPDPRDKYFVQDLKSAKFRGVIRAKEIDKNNITWYWVEMGVKDNYEEGDDEGLTIRCRLGDDVSIIPQVDDIASGKITFSNDKQKRVFGTIYHIDPPRRRQRRW